MAKSLTLIWYNKSAETGQMIKTDKENATALPAPCFNACRKSKLSRTVVKYKCRADVQMMRTKVKVCKNEKR